MPQNQMRANNLKDVSPLAVARTLTHACPDRAQPPMTPNSAKKNVKRQKGKKKKKEKKNHHEMQEARNGRAE